MIDLTTANSAPPDGAPARPAALAGAPQRTAPPAPAPPAVAHHEPAAARPAAAHPDPAPAPADRGAVTISPEECKGCGLCVAACVSKVLHLSAALNRLGYHPAEYLGHGCNGCGVCYYACPEPGALRVWKRLAAA